jgi:hypothetical protein
MEKTKEETSVHTLFDHKINHGTVEELNAKILKRKSATVTIN